MRKIQDLVFADYQSKMNVIAETVGISKDCMGHILHDILSMRKLSALWVPYLLTSDNKHKPVTTLEQYLTLFKCNPKEFLRRFVTVDETWIHWYTQETVTHTTVIWDSQGVIYIDHLEKSNTVTGMYYA